MLIDTHSHLNFSVFKETFNKIIKECFLQNIQIINVGTKYETSEKALEIAKMYKEGVYAAVGLHPIHLETGLVKIKDDTQEIEIKTKEENFNYEKYKNLAKDKKVVAIGEIGFDFYWTPKSKEKKEILEEKQKENFILQLELARELNLPIILHCRLANKEMLTILKNYKNKIRGVIHCFVGTLKDLEEYLKLDFFIGFNGIIFKNIEGIDFKEIILNTPLNKILLETDCPYFTPLGFDEKINNPLGLPLIAKEIAKIKNISFEQISNITTQNAKELFSL
ncbi:MAG: TatD family hydrolase [Minisyncoccia bacterium]